MEQQTPCGGRSFGDTGVTPGAGLQVVEILHITKRLMVSVGRRRSYRQLMGVRVLIHHSLQAVSDDPLERRNVFRLILAECCTSAGLLFVTGTVLQAYLVKVGLTNAQLGVIGSVGSVVNVIGMCALMGWADRTARRPQAVMACCLIMAITPFTLTLVSPLSAGRISQEAILAIVLVAEMIRQMASSFQVMVFASTFVRVMRPVMRGRYAGASGFSVGVISVCLGLASAEILQFYGFPAGFTVCFGIATLLSLAGALSFGKLTELPALKGTTGNGYTSPVAAVWEILRLPQFRRLLAPNLLRGLIAGVPYFIMAVGMKRLQLPAEYGGLMATATAIAGMAGAVSIGLTLHLVGSGRMCLFGAILFAIALLGLAFTGWPPLFLALYALMAFGLHLEAAAVPLGTYEIAPFEVMGAFNGARLMLLSAGSALSTFVVGHLLDAVDPVPIFLTAAGLKILNGVWYWHGFRRKA